MSAAKEKTFSGKIAAWLAVLFILLVPMAIGTSTASALPVRLDCSLQSRTGENSSSAAKSGAQNAGYLNRYGCSAYIGKSDTPGARQSPIATGLVLGTYVPEVSCTAYPTQYGQYIIPNLRPATSRFGRDPPVRLQPSTVYDGGTRYDGTSGFPLAAESTGGLENANFAQKTFSPAFSPNGTFAGRTAQDVAAALRSGAMTPADVPVQYIERDGQTLILNTRSAQALEQAGIPRAQWNAVNVTGNADAEARLTRQLLNNGLTSAGTPTVRPSGGG